MNVCMCSESRLTSFWSLVTDVDRQIFANDKFLLQASNDGNVYSVTPEH